MKRLDRPEIERWRSRDPAVERYYGEFGDDKAGVFVCRVRTGPRRRRATLTVIASSGGGWDHVSVSTPRRTPTWAEMEAVKRLFFRPDETAVQLHVPPAQHISRHPHCLHIWRPHGVAIPLPPAWMVA